MAERTRLAAAGFFLALTLAVVPALLPARFAGATVAQSAEAARPFVRLKGGPLTEPATSHPEVMPEGVLQAAISNVTPRSHSVAQGETLWMISQDAGITVQALAAANRLMLGTTLQPGQVLMIPPFDPAPGRPPRFTHHVEVGETLWGISRDTGVGVEALAAANHLSMNAVLHPGQTLVVPAAGEAAPALSTEQARGRDRALSGRTAARVRFGFRALASDARSLEQPSAGLLTSRFGWRMHPIFGTREFHTGVDIANHIGTPIRAAESGIVRFVGWMGGYGRLIVVAHANGLETSYSHLSSMLVGLGQRVARGDLLGRMGNSGWSTGPHLFFEVRRNGVPLDPLPFLGGQTALRIQAADPDAATVRPAARQSSAPARKPVPALPKPAAVSPGAVSTAPAETDGPASAPSKEHRVATDVVTETPPATPTQPAAPPQPVAPH